MRGPSINYSEYHLYAFWKSSDFHDQKYPNVKINLILFIVSILFTQKNFCFETSVSLRVRSESK